MVLFPIGDIITCTNVLLVVRGDGSAIFYEKMRTPNGIYSSTRGDTDVNL